MNHNRLWTIGEQPVVIAHRGGGLEAPENSFAAFERLHGLGIRHIETDVHATKDGIPVIIHDPLLDRVSDGHGLVRDYTWADLVSIHDHSGAGLMRLEDALEAFPEAIFNIDAKENRVVAPLIAAITSTRSQHRVCLASFNEHRLITLRKALPGVATSLGVSVVVKLALALKLPRTLRNRIVATLPKVNQGVQAIQVPKTFRGIHLVDEKFVHVAHACGWAVHVWTINDLDTAADLLSIGVDGIVTDIPTQIKALIDKR